MRSLPSTVFLLAFALSSPAFASGGPLGIDHRLHYDNSGIWKRSNQNILIYGSIVTVAGAALGAGVGIWAAHRKSPLIVGWLPGGFQIGFVHHFKP